MYKFKQVIVMRQLFPDKEGKPRKLRTGKYTSQAAHASLTAVMENFIVDGVFDPKGLEEWFKVSGQAKITVYVQTEEELLAVYAAGKAAGLPTSLILDNGHTEFGSVPTYTAVAIGPALSEDIDKITGHLPLM